MKALARLLLCAALAAVALGLLGGWRVLGEGLEATGKSRTVLWGVFVTNLMYLTGIAHTAAWVAALRLRSAPGLAWLAASLALVSAGVGGLNPLLHLGRPWQFYYTMTAPQIRSGLFWDMAGVQLFAGAAAALLLALRFLPRLAPLLAWAAALAALLAELAGELLFARTSVPMWGHPLAVVQGMAVAACCGLAALLLARGLLRAGPATGDGMPGALLAALLVTLALTFLEHLRAVLGGDAADGVVAWSRLVGEDRARFWGGLTLGLFLPLLLLARRASRSPRLVALAAALVLVGLWIERYLGIVGPLAHPRLAPPLARPELSQVDLMLTAGEMGAVVLGLALLWRLGPRPVAA